MDEGVVESISADTVGRILNNHRLKPWRHHLWLSPKVPRDAAFAAQVREICDLYTRVLAAHEVVLCVDEKTSLQPRTRKAPTRPALPGQPVRVEHEYERKGALNLFAAFDTRTGRPPVFSPLGRAAPGQDGVRATRRVRPLAGQVGLPRIGAATGG